MRVHSCLAASLAALALCACSQSAPPAAPSATVIGPADDQTMTIVTAAQAYVASLSPAQQTASLFAYRDAAQRARWSNLPTDVFERKGVKWGDLNETQRARLMDLLNAVLSEDGVRLLGAQMEADEFLRENPDAGATGPDGPPPGSRAPEGPWPPLTEGQQRFGAGLYYIAFLGAPSVTAPWTLQFGGHHLAINATIVGPNLTIAPSLTGGRPVTFESDGKRVDIAATEVGQAQALMDSLTPEQRAKAVLGDSTADLQLGPGRDGWTLRREGLQANLMTAAQKEKLVALIAARVGLMNANDAAAAMARIRDNIDQTWFAWYGPTAQAGGAYFRVSGPTIVMEFSPQDVLNGGVSNHLHNIYRDPTNDYGVAWAPIR